MRILLLNYEFPPVGGGAATASAQIAAHMARRGVEVAVLSSHLKGLPHLEERDGYVIRRVPVMRKHPDRCSLPEMGTFIAGAALPAVRMAESFRPDIMHVFFGMPTGPVGLLVHQLKGVPYLLSLRGDDVPGRQEGGLALAHRLMKPLTQRIWSNASMLVVNGEGLQARAVRTLPGRRIDIVPNGVDTDLFRPRTGERSAQDKVQLLFVGRLHKQKGLSYLLRGMAGLAPDRLARVELELVGSGPDEGPLRELATQLGLNGQVRFSGWVDRKDIVKHYQQADVFVFPSFEEGMPNVVLEAMACGNTIVATDIPGVRGLVQDGRNGLLVPVSNAGAFTQALETLIADEGLRASMGRQSREMACGMSWASVAARYLEMSTQVVARTERRNVSVAQIR